LTNGDELLKKKEKKKTKKKKIITLAWQAPTTTTLSLNTYNTKQLLSAFVERSIHLAVAIDFNDFRAGQQLHHQTLHATR
jgi:hypothetical protein